MAAETEDQSAPKWEDTGRKIAAVRAREMSMRDAAEFDLPFRAGPFNLRQMLPQDALLLYATENGIFRGAHPTFVQADQLFAFLRLLVVRSRFMPSLVHSFLLARKLIMLRWREKAWSRLMDDLDKYQRETFVDWPTEGGESREGGVRGSFLSSLFDLIASEYHWTESEIRKTPIRRLLIRRKHIIARREAEQGHEFTDVSHEERRLKNDYLVALNDYAAKAAAGGRN